MLNVVIFSTEISKPSTGVWNTAFPYVRSKCCMLLKTESKCFMRNLIFCISAHCIETLMVPHSLNCYGARYGNIYATCVTINCHTISYTLPSHDG